MLTASELVLALRQEVYRVVGEFLSSTGILSPSERERIVNQTCPLIWDDLCSFAERDPAARKSREYIAILNEL